MITCPNCGKQNQDHYKFCLGCGSELPRDQVKAPAHASSPTPPSGMPAVSPPAEGQPPQMAPAPAAPAAQPEPQPQAQPEPQPQAQPEPQPQAQPEPQAGPLKCPSCGADVPQGFKFCGRCGHPMEQQAAPTQPEPAAAAAPAAEPSTALGRIIMIQPDGSEGTSLPIGESGVTVGRTSEPPFNEDFFLSPEHARFKFSEPGKLMVEDLGSLNGVYIRLVPEQTYEVKPGDMLRLGQEVVRIDVLDPPATSDDGTGIMGSPRKQAWGRLSLIVSKGKVGNAFLLEGEETLVGRERGHIIFPEDGYVSGLHLKITRQGETISIMDVGSSNGSYLKVDGSSEINSGDYALMGQFLYRVEF